MQVTVISGLFAVLCYAAGSVFQGMRFTSKQDTGHLVMLFGGLAVFAHVVSAMSVIRTPAGYQFGIVEISTLVTAIGSLLVLVSSLRKPLENLFLGLFPLAILAIIASLTLRSDYPPTQLASGLASHVMLSILAYSVMTIAALQAVFLAYQNYKLKHGQAGGLLRKFPPLQDMEVFLFELLWFGMLLLSAGIIAGLFFVDDIFSREGVLHKTFFSMLSWVVFAALLWGRHQLGWRGRTAIRGTFIGFGLLIVGFYGSKIVLQYILG